MKYLWLLLLGFICIGLVYLKNKEGFQTSPNAIVIVEPRKHKDLAKVIKNFDELMPKDWDLYVFHGKSSADFAKEATSGISRKVFLEPLDSDNLTADEYNKLFGKESFWDRVQAENILVFQTDTALCKNSKFKIDDFSKYDYIGCSVNKNVYAFDEPWWYEGKSPFYGIGGLSFRKKSFMKRCIAKYPEKAQNMPEDAFFSMCVQQSPNKPPSGQVLTEFCTQHHFNSNSFGAHKTKELAEQDRNTFYEYCPESSFLKEQFTNFVL